MNAYKKLKSFESYMGAGDDTDEEKTPKISDEQINARLKEIILELLEAKQYFEMLKDSTEQVFEMVYNAIPSNSHDFSNALYSKNDLLGELVDEIMETIEGSNMVDDLSIILDDMQKVSDLVEDNWDNVFKNNDEGEEFEDDEDDDDDDDDPFIDEEEFDESEKDNNKPNDDSKDQHNLPIKEALKKIEDLEGFVKKYTKKEPEEKYKKGDIVYLHGIKTEQGEKLNGKKAEIIRKCDDKKDCYDLFVDALPHRGSSNANVKGMPEKFISKEKVKEVEKEKETPKRVKYKATRKAK